MKERSKFFVLVFAATFLLAGCATSLTSVNMKKEIIGATPRESLSVMYSKTYFQERFMGKSLPTFLLLGEPFRYLLINYEDKTAARLESSEFEKLLGDFDVSDFFLRQLDQKITSSKYIKFTFTQDVDTSQKVLQFIKCDSPNECAIVGKNINKQKFSYVTALKMSYGLGARQGNEQFGFSKSYRPFIRLIGVVKSLDTTNEILWRDDIIVFGHKRYVGSDASADRIDREELVASLKNLTAEVITMLLRSLDGDQLGEMPIMVDTTSADLEF